MADSGWLKRYRPGHINGINFYMDSHSATVGRRKVVHEFPGRDDVEVEDLGVLPDKFSLDIYILADDYFADRDALIREIKAEESVQLLHPYLGPYTVHILSCTFAERYDEGRMVRFRISAIQSGAKLFTLAVVDTKVDILEKRGTLFAKFKAYFLTAYTITQGPLEEINKIVATLDDAAGLILDAKKVVASVADYQRQAQRIYGRLQLLALSGGDLIDEFANIILFGANVLDDVIDDIDIFTSSAGSREQFFELRNITDSTMVGTDPDDNSALINNMVLVNTVASMAGLAATIDYTTREDSNRVVQILVNLFDFIETDSLMTTDVKEAVRDLRTSVINDADTRSASLGTTYIYNVMDQSLPSLVIANTIYGDITNEETIVEDNNVESPFFIGGKVTVVVNDV